ncbi:hypothetical protein K1719_003365 [Acacia pycnantha]|nr:hypothetical protein K1719_003365 [Acacia pycnantha]
MFLEKVNRSSLLVSSIVASKLRGNDSHTNLCTQQECCSSRRTSHCPLWLLKVSSLNTDIVSGATKTLGRIAVDGQGCLIWLEWRPTESGISVGHVPPRSLHVPTPSKLELPPSFSDKLISVKRFVDVGDRWLVAFHGNVKTHCFRLTPKQLDHLVTTIITSAPTSYFVILSAIVWKCLSHIRGNASGLNAVTICINGSKRKEDELPINGLVFSKVEADFAVEKSDVSELATLIGEKKVMENDILEKMVEEDEGEGDFVVYGANLTFVDLEGAEFYDVKLNGQKTILVNCTFHGVADEGVVSVLLALEGDDDAEDGDGDESLEHVLIDFCN